MHSLAPLTSAQIARAFARVKREYLLMRPESSPAKLSMDISRAADGSLGVFGNAMIARLSTGEWGGKFITVNEETGDMVAQTLVFDRSGALIANIPSADLTRWRCGLMAAVSVDLYYGDFAYDYSFSIGLIGSGRTNAATFEIFKQIFGIPARSFVVSGSPRNRQKNIHMFPGAVFATELKSSGTDFSFCDVIIECATIRNKEEKLEVTDFDFGNIPKLFIAQDSGWLLGPTFRQGKTALPSFTDHVEQINAHAKGDYDWPWDDVPPVITRNMLDASFDSWNTMGRAVVYLTGIALADIVLALEVSR